MTFRPNQDIIYQEIKVFIEGVQVPFVNVQVNSGIGTLPSAVVVVPPFPGLMEICRYYNPKVHIFYTDQFKDENKECVLFMGHISNVQYNKSRQAGSTHITFNCIHKNNLMKDILVDFNSPMENTVLRTGVRVDNAVSIGSMGTQQSLITALRGICDIQGKLPFDNLNSEEIQREFKEGNLIADPSIMGTELQKEGFRSRFRGFPGVLLNLWNQYKSGSVINPIDFEAVLVYTDVVEIGIKYFKRLAGHNFIEDAMDAGKIPYCPDKTQGQAGATPINVPPSLRLFVQSAVQTDIALEVVRNGLNFSGELTNLLNIFNTLIDRIEYEMITLTSPAETRLDMDKDWSESNSYAVETIVKPQIPFYFSPSCNVYYPNMYHSLNVMQDEDNIPTRITLTAKVMKTSDSPAHRNYRAPASIREAIVKAYSRDKESEAKTEEEKLLPKEKATDEAVKSAYNGSNLITSTDGFKNRTRVGMYEIGRGVRHKRTEVPYWLSIYMSSMNNVKKEDQEKSPFSEADKESLELLKNAWNYRYGEHKRHLNPYDENSGAQPYERMLFAAADYKYTMEVASSRAGQIDGVFNPYIIPGYPMDILDANPVNPSFHATCASVSHNISAGGISTYVTFVAAITYTELANYHMMYVHPWLQTHLQIVNAEPEGIETMSFEEMTGFSNENKDANDLRIEQSQGYSIDESNEDARDRRLRQSFNGKYKYNSSIVNNPFAKVVADRYYSQVQH